MYASVLLLVACWSVSGQVIPKPYFDIDKAAEYFDDFIERYEKTYDSDEEIALRFETFVNNLKMVNDLNTKNELTIFGISPFMDLTMEEIVKDHTGLAQSDSANCRILNDDDINDDLNIPESWDWRNSNVVSRVKDQGKCSSAYAFSAVGQLESLYAIKYGKTLEFSEQQVIDCDAKSDKCCGGHVSSAFRYLNITGGIVESKYDAYLQEYRHCNTHFYWRVANVTNCYSYDLKSQEKVKQLLYQHGPISVAIKVSGLGKHYIGGILTDDFCAEGNLDHTVLLVGYGSENNVPYWIAKNSWGEKFGEEGYFRIQRGNDAYSCGLMNLFMTTADIENLVDL